MVLLSSTPPFVESALFSGTPNQLVRVEKRTRQHREPCHKLTPTVSNNQQCAFDQRENRLVRPILLCFLSSEHASGKFVQGWGSSAVRWCPSHRKDLATLSTTLVFKEVIVVLI